MEHTTVVCLNPARTNSGHYTSIMSIFLKHLKLIRFSGRSHCTQFLLTAGQTFFFFCSSYFILQWSILYYSSAWADFSCLGPAFLNTACTWPEPGPFQPVIFFNINEALCTLRLLWRYFPYTICILVHVLELLSLSRLFTGILSVLSVN